MRERDSYLGIAGPVAGGVSLDLTEKQRRVADFALSSDRLHLILMATEQCNFRCVYCYEDFAIGRMRPWVVEGVKNLVATRIADISELFYLVVWR